MARTVQGATGSPSLQDYIYVADYTYNQGTNTSPYPNGLSPYGLSPLMSGGAPVEEYDARTGFYGEAFVTAQRQVIIGFEGTNLFTDQLTPPNPTAAQFTGSQVIDDAQIYAGVNALSYQTALQFTRAVIKDAAAEGISKSNVFLAGHSLGAADVEYVATQTGLAGTTFGTPGIPAADINPNIPSKLNNYSSDGDPVGNYYSGSVLGAIVNNSAIEQYGILHKLPSNEAFLLTDAAADYQQGGLANLGFAAADLATAVATNHPLEDYATALGLNLPSGDKSLLGLPSQGGNISVQGGNINNYTFTQTATGVTVSGAEGTEQLTHSPTIQFANGSVTFDTSHNAAEIFSIYQAAFGRQPDVAGETYWLNVLNGSTPETTIAAQFASSPEFVSRYGANTSNQQYLTALYQNVVGRAPDSAGDAYWLARLSAGETRAQLLIDFADSAENQAHVTPLVGQGVLVEHLGVAG